MLFVLPADFDLQISISVDESASRQKSPDRQTHSCGRPNAFGDAWLEFARKYDCRYSVLPLVLATLVKQGHMSENDLEGLDQEKIELILDPASHL
ncbi:MAG: hypothetical protein JO217_05015 [Acidobacteriaceae bacterium]|nr:hypothetical protein [Acidobacteriaceae bacterium]MBV9442035.1 hypothetical protein [Acidobacteriaceae bacterium]